MQKKGFCFLWRNMGVEGVGDMKIKHIDYARKLCIIADWLDNISDKFRIINLDNMKNTEEIKIIQKIYMSGIEEIKICKLILQDIVPPVIVSNEHQKMITGIQSFIDGLEKAYNSLDTIHYKVDNINIDMYNEGKKLREEGIDLAVKSAEEIVRKLTE